MKRVLFIIPSLCAGGAERQSVTLAISMKNINYEIEFCCYYPMNFFDSLLYSHGIKVHRKNCNYLHRVFFVLRVIQQGRFDVVISFMPTPNFLNGLAACVLGKRWKMIISERTAVKNNLLSCRGKFYGHFYRKADAVVCNSENSFKLWSKYYPGLSNKLHVIYNMVTLGKSDTLYTPHKNNKLNVVVAATLYRTKNPMGLLMALSLMSEEERQRLHIDWYGRSEAIIGDHAEYDRVVATIKDRHLESVIAIHDATKDIENRMIEADCVALFSMFEGLPNAICEAMAIGKPIIMTYVSDYNILIEENVNGHCCQWDNPISIKDTLLKMSSYTGEELLQMGAASKEKALHLFSSEKILNQWIDVIEYR